MIFGTDRYELNSTALEKLENSGLKNKIDKSCCYFIPFNLEELCEQFNDMRERTRTAEQKRFYEKLDLILETIVRAETEKQVQIPADYYWQFEEGTRILEPKLEDIIIYSGTLISPVEDYDLVTERDLFNYSKFGFETLEEFFGVTGAYIMNQKKLKTNTTEIARFKGLDNEQIEVEITGDDNCDLQINFLNITPHSRTISPIGNPAQFYPIRYTHKIQAYHSTEPNLFVALLKYAQHCGISKEQLFDKDFAKYVKGLEQQIGNATPFLEDFHGKQVLHNLRYELPPITARISMYMLPTNNDFSHEFYIGTENELVIVSEDKDKYDFSLGTQNTLFPITKKRHHAYITKDGIKPMIRALFEQSAKGLGRTQICILTSMIREYLCGIEEE